VLRAHQEALALEAAAGELTITQMRVVNRTLSGKLAELRGTDRQGRADQRARRTGRLRQRPRPFWQALSVTRKRAIVDTLMVGDHHAGGPMAAGLALSVRAAKQWESSLAGVAKAVDDNAKQMAELESRLRSLSPSSVASRPRSPRPTGRSLPSPRPPGSLASSARTSRGSPRRWWPYSAHQQEPRGDSQGLTVAALPADGVGQQGKDPAAASRSARTRGPATRRPGWHGVSVLQVL
jgi:hypothetical protein